MRVNKLRDFSAKSGAYVGVGFVFVYMLNHFLYGTLHTISDFSGNATFILQMLGVVFFTKKYRGDKTYFAYFDAFKVTFLISLFAWFIGGFFLYIYYSFIHPEALNQFLNLQQNVFLASGMSEEQTIQLVNLMKSMISPGVLSFSIFFGGVFVGLIISLISALFLKKGTRNPNSFDRTMSQIDE